MTISFKCVCGRTIEVPDESAGREAFCPACRKKATVPAAGLGPVPSDAPDRREGSEFRPGSLAQLLGSSPTGEAAGPAPAPAAPAVPAPQAASPTSAAPATPAAASAPDSGPSSEPAKSAPGRGAAEPVIEIFPDRIKFHCECGQKVSAKLPASHSAGKCPKCGRSLRVPQMPGDPKAQGPHPRKHRGPTKTKVNCLKCGRLIEDLSAAFCPRCGFPLALRPPVKAPAQDAGEIKVLPVDPGATTASATGVVPPPALAPMPPAPAPTAGPAEAYAPKIVPLPSPDIRQRNAREAAEIAANLLRPSSPSSPAASRGADDAAPAGLVRRLAAFVLDAAIAAALGFLSMRLAPAGALAPGKAFAAGAGACLFVNEALFAAMAGGRSLGMLVCGVAVFGSSGRPAGIFVLTFRLMAWLLLFVGAPLALFERRRRTLHDMVCGTTVR